MKKIKEINLPLRIKEIRRRAQKDGLDLAALGVSAESELELQKWLETPFGLLAPAVIYDSYEPDVQLPEGVREPRTLATSVCVTTLGPKLDAALDAAQGAERALLELLREVTLEESQRFVLRLLTNEAKDEQCELGEARRWSDPAVEAALLEKLDAGRIGVTRGEAGMTPAASLLFTVGWTPQKKKAKAK